MPPIRADRPTLIVDAYNALHVVGVLPPEIAGPDLTDLARLIARSRWADRLAWLVCDGAPAGSARHAKMLRSPAPGAPGVEIVHAGAGRDADSAIERLIERDSAPKRLLVVSSDRRILKAARKRRAGAMPSERFLAVLATDAAKPSGRRAPQAPEVPLADDAVRHWVDRFDAHDIDIPPAPDPLASRDPKPTEEPPQDDPDGAPDGRPDRSLRDDPLIREALREWDGRLDLEDLDMRRWLGEE